VIVKAKPIDSAIAKVEQHIDSEILLVLVPFPDMKRFAKNTILILIGFLITTSAIAQDEEAAYRSNFQKFQDLETADEQLNFFFNASDLYRETSTYDWQDLITIKYLNPAVKGKDDEKVKRYKLIQSRIYYDLGDFERSVAISKELLTDIDNLDIYLKSKLLDLLDDSYGKLTMYPQQIKIREKKRALDITENVAFYDVYANLGMYREALKDYIDNVKKTLKDDDYEGQAVYYNNLGNYLRMDGSVATALSNYKKGKNFADLLVANVSRKKLENEIGEAKSFKAVVEGNIGKCHLLLKQYESAIGRLEVALKTLREYDNGTYSSEITENSLAISECYLQMEDYAKATDYLSDDLQTKTVETIMLKNRLLALYYDKTNDFKNSLFYYKRNIRILDSISGKDSELRKQQLGTVMNQQLQISKDMLAEKREDLEKSKIELFAKDKRNNLVLISLLFTLLGFAGLVYAYLKSIKNQRLIAEQKYIIENSLVEKDSLLKEIHHRVKNNLQMVSSLLSLQTKNTRSKAAIEALEEGKSRVKAMALIHQKLYQNEDLSVIEMQSYIESLINSVQSVYKKGGHNIKISIDAEGVELDIDRAIPFGLMLNELVSNSFKYAFPENDEKGKIYIHIRKIDEKDGYFEYSDNGIGLPEDTEERASSSMGIRLMNRLANQLQTTLNIDKEAEDGVRYWFNFK